ncbi:SIMPL domain-containing protein [Amphritea atlantica]|uniref:SIMPL domain-containing protein n=1 Tax=Amphritea atlantica TaxID=355243 RepID=A0ABY5GPU1_9GAMM|nr:SIMPL domain-containing protein [Amphritea atlantica]
MLKDSRVGWIFIGLSLFLGLSSLGYLLGDAAIRFKEYERTVTVKGLSEREYKADIVIWPIQFTTAGNDLAKVYSSIDQSTENITAFLKHAGIDETEISFSSPAITDKSAQQYGGQSQPEFRYTASQSVTVYSANIDTVRKLMKRMSELGKQGIVFTGDSYQSQIEYLFTRLNEVKPEMIEEATRKAREVAEKFAADSKSSLGKIRSASQGQFSISERDKNNPHIKKVRVVSTVAYYLSD